VRCATVSRSVKLAPISATPLRGFCRGLATGTTSWCAPCLTRASAHARPVPRSAIGTPSIIVIAQSAQRCVEPASRHVAPCSTQSWDSNTRSILLPSGVDAQAIKAETHDGVVEVTVPLPSDSTKQAIQITSAPGSEQKEQTGGPM
jgi:hypothetical protein